MCHTHSYKSSVGVGGFLCVFLYVCGCWVILVWGSFFGGEGGNVFFCLSGLETN